MLPARESVMPSASTPSPGRRFLTLFTSGLTTKPRSIAELDIKLDQEGRTYFTADTIRGSVRFRVLRPVRITHITVSLSGRVQVFKNPITPGESSGASVLSSTSKGRTGGQYHGNGVATLFEEETVLCGDGRLTEGSYQFNFELDFPPERDLPSSVDFERGKISYAITANITRPTTIAPVTSYERDVVFTERIDVASIYPPKARTIILEPLTKRSKSKSLKLRDNSSTFTSNTDRRSLATRSPQPEHASEASIRPSISSQEHDRALSPVPSEHSVDSHPSSTGMPSQNGSVSASVSPAASLVSKSKNGVYKTIGTTIESLTGGCLRGDQLSVKVTVNHSKYMKSMNGVIVTLYRHARVDTQPALSIGPLDQPKSESKQSYFPQSRTGLSGLSLSGAGSARVFRKDLAQTVSPLVINPSTLTADVLVKLRVPEFAFPTISGVPGAMISFKYYVEVIVDIQGKLSPPSNPLSELTRGVTLPAETNDADYANTMLHGSRILDTTHVRRDKGVVCSNFEIIIGTVDSERRKNKGKAVAVDEPASIPQELTPTTPSRPPAFASLQGLGMSDELLGRQYSHTNSIYAPEYQPYTPRTNGRHDDYLAVPQLSDESQLSEKERIRLAEARLLPSQPPGMDDNTDGVVGASAPVLDDDYSVPYTATAPVLDGEFDEIYYGLQLDGQPPTPVYAGPGASYGRRYSGPAPQDEYSLPTAPSSARINGGMGGATDRALDSVQDVSHEREASAPQQDEYWRAEASSSRHADGPGLERRLFTEETSEGMPTTNQQADAQQNHNISPAASDSVHAGSPAGSSQQHDSHADATPMAGLPRYER